MERLSQPKLGPFGDGGLVGVMGKNGGADSTVTINHNGASTEPGLSNEELIKRKRAELGDLDPAKKDAADIALRDVMSGKVRRARGGSTSSALGLFAPTAPLGRDSILGSM